MSDPRASADLTRRRFLRATAAVGGPLILASPQTAFSFRANDRLRLAIVGMAGYGAYFGFAAAIHTYANVEYAVTCDVDLRKVRRVYDLWRQRAAQWSRSDQSAERAAAEIYERLASVKPPLYADFRRMLDEAANQFDAVVVATPDHTHANIAAAALRAGKPVLVEKPLAISAHEARALHRLAQRHERLPTQMNNHGAATRGFRRGVEILREGQLGPIREVHVFFSRGGRDFAATPQGTQEAPPELNWDLWLAQVRWRAYHSEWINRIAWRETSLGELGNFGPHSANMAFMGLNVGDLWRDDGGGKRIRVRAECSRANQVSYPRWERIHWEIPPRGELPAVTFTWHHGYPPDYAPGSRAQLEQTLRDHGAADRELTDLLPSAGCLILGSRGLLATNSHNTTVRLLPADRFTGVEQAQPLRTPVPPSHYGEWIDACRGGPRPMSCFEYVAPFAEFLAVGSLATRFPDETIEFEPASGRIANHPRAAEFLSYAYRAGYTI